MSSKYLLASDVKDQIYDKLLQTKAVAGLIREVTSPGFDSENDDVNTSAWLISEQLESILISFEKLPIQGEKICQIKK